MENTTPKIQKLSKYHQIPKVFLAGRLCAEAQSFSFVWQYLKEGGRRAGKKV